MNINQTPVGSCYIKTQYRYKTFCNSLYSRRKSNQLDHFVNYKKMLP